MVDPLTQIWNRRAFLELAAQELSRARRHGSAVGLLMVDLDHFKRINDVHGHPAGDAVLVEVAARVRGVLRESDQVARYGGEELVVLVPGCGPAGAYAVAERVRRAIGGRTVRFGGAGLRVTASLGVAAARDAGERLQGLIARADEALYRAKRAGRDRTVVAAPLEIERKSS
jgi:diguanylate cyclase (GGDEF)-like protein